MPDVQGLQERVPAVGGHGDAEERGAAPGPPGATGTPLRSRVFGGIRALNRLGAATAPLSNLPGRVPALRRLLGRTLGIAPQRPLPVFARRTLPRWFRGGPAARRGRAAAR